MVITFLPYESFVKSAKVLDRQRLGKQRSETRIILDALNDYTHHYHRHAATRMWKGYKNTLALYGMVITLEWVHRGYRDESIQNIMDHFDESLYYALSNTYGNDYEAMQKQIKETLPYPKWLGDPRVHESHQAMLLHKDLMFYCTKFDSIKLKHIKDYYWPC